MLTRSLGRARGLRQSAHCRAFRNLRSSAASRSHGDALTEQELREANEYWRAKLDEVSPNGHLDYLREQLDPLSSKAPMGLTAASATTGNTSNIKREANRFKRRHLYKLILVRSGDFYCLCGVDAIIAHELCGLHPQSFTPMVGFQCASVQKYLDLLTSKNHSVVVVEENVREKARHRTAERKTRHVQQVVTPDDPDYVYAVHQGEEGFSDGRLEKDARTVPTPALLAKSSTGGSVEYSLALFHRGPGEVQLLDGLSDESILDILESRCPFGSAFVVHKGVEKRADGTGIDLSEPKWNFTHILPLNCEAGEFFSRAQEAVKEFFELDRDFDWVHSDESNNRPFPLSSETRDQIGISSRPGIPPLIPHILGEDAARKPRLRAFVQDWLTWPRPRKAVERFADLLHAVYDIEEGLPDSTSPELVGRFRHADVDGMAKEAVGAQVNYFADESLRHSMRVEPFINVYRMLEGIEDVLSQPAYASIKEPLLAIVEHEQSLKVKEDELLASVHACMRIIDGNINLDDQPDPPSCSGKLVDGHANAAKCHALHYFTDDNESSFRGRLKPSQYEGDSSVARAVKEVNRKGQLIKATLKDEFGIGDDNKNVQETLQTLSDHLLYDRNANEIVFNEGKLQQAGIECPPETTNPTTRSGKDKQARAKKTKTTPALKSAIDDYLDAIFEADKAVSIAIQHLAKELKQHIRHLCTASLMSVILGVALAHMRQVGYSRWSPAARCEGQEELKAVNFWPFWLSHESNVTVKNSVTLGKPTLLTGPNMGGKSCLLRSVAAVQVLGMTGFFVPAEGARVPLSSRILMKMTGGDSPLDQKSSHKLDMEHLARIQRRASSKDTVYIDELGNGTDPSYGAACIAQLVLDLGDRGTKGILSTHFYDLISSGGIALSPGVDFWRMAVSNDEMHQPQPSFKVEPGVSRESLAVAVAEEAGVERTDNIEKMQQQIRSSLGRPSADFESVNRSLDVADETREASDGVACLEERFRSDPTHTNVDVKQEVKDGLDGVRELVESCLDALLEGREEAEVKCLPPKQTPPSHVSGRSTVYVLVPTKGTGIYIGQSERLHKRREELRKSYGPHYMLYSVVPPGKSKSVEANLIKRLGESGFLVLNRSQGFKSYETR